VLRPSLLSLFFIFFFGDLSAQLCQGSLGDPIVNITFGGGQNPGPPLPAAALGYQYVTPDCPGDGFYTVRNNTTGCFGNTWHSVASDHTGNGNGYFMLVNASNQPGDFYVDTIRGLCGSTTYEFAAWVMNVIRPGSCGGNTIRPNITLRIERTDGTVLQQYSTGNIEPGPDPVWNQYGFFFSTPASGQDIVLRMRNNAPGGCGNDLLLDDITFRPCGPQLTPFFPGAAGPEKEICQGETASVVLSCDVSPGFTSPYFQWQESVDNGATWSDLAGANSPSFTKALTAATLPGRYLYRLTVVETANIGNNSCRIASQALTIRVNALPVTVAGNSGPVCAGGSLNLIAAGGAGYQWMGPNGFSASTPSTAIPMVVLADTGFYYVTVTSDLGCRKLDSTHVSVFPRPQVVVLPSVVSICDGDDVRLTASGGSSYEWSPAASLSSTTIPDPLAAPHDSTRYRVVVTTAAGCVDSGFALVTVLKAPHANAGPDKVLIEGDATRLDGSVSGSGFTFDWAPQFSISDEGSLRPLVFPPLDTAYILTVTSTAGCGEARDTVRVKVYKRVQIPNAFSPNGDGVNDRWEIPALAAYNNVSLLVFNRYGQPVFESRRYVQPWDGNYGGKPLPVGTYYYVIEIRDRGTRLSGSVGIIR
jgi:gliding motility-associated-like protein